MSELIIKAFDVPLSDINYFWQYIKKFFNTKKEITYLMIENYSEENMELGLFLKKGDFPDLWPIPSYLWPSGFIFNENNELYWRCEIDNFIFRLTQVENDMVISELIKEYIIDKKIITYSKINKAKFLCFGTYSNKLNKWLEGQIPRPISYSVEPENYPFIIVNEYFNDKELILSSFSGMTSDKDIKSL